jgi:hypothetical protein
MMESLTTLRHKIAGRLLGEHSHHVMRAWRAARRRVPLEPSLNLRVARRFVASHGLEVSGGPFAGLVFPPAAVGAGPLPAKLVGAYECELHDVMEERIAARPSRVVNVGSAEGYYAIGFARRLPHATVIAFDPDREAQRLTRLGARANGVASRLQQRGLATAGEISDLEPDADTLLFVDCEGAEDDLLDPDRLPCLRVTPIVVELHEHVVPGIGERLTGRFQATHELTRIWAADRASFHLDAPFASWPQRDRDALLDEGRPPSMSWLVMAPRPAA